ncbi:MAG: hypothetical protein SFX74_04735, partial [Fimbriimonadaceae bacterium]|nr:hypothetical protein [Fimbriimonadaceae bacterium]
VCVVLEEGQRWGQFAEGSRFSRQELQQWRSELPVFRELVLAPWPGPQVAQPDLWERRDWALRRVGKPELIRSELAFLQFPVALSAVPSFGPCLGPDRLKSRTAALLVRGFKSAETRHGIIFSLVDLTRSRKV